MKFYSKITWITLTLLATLTVSCTPPNASTPDTESVKQNDTLSEDNEKPAAVTVEGQIAADKLTRTQFVNALKCATEKTDDTSLAAGFDSQITLFGSSSSESQFNELMKTGGGGSYIIYKEAAKIGCTGK